MTDGTSLVDRLLTPKLALLANGALVIAGSVAGLFGILDTISGAVVVAIGFLGIGLVLYGQRRS